MSYRTLEISKPAEIHVKKGQLEITNSEGMVSVPLCDLATIVCSGANIRMSTMAQAQIAENGISLMIINAKYRPACILLPTESNARQTLFMRKQVTMTADDKNQIWTELISRKIENQARALKLLGKEGEEKVLKYAEGITEETVDAREANAAKEYFYHLHPGLKRRTESPINSCMNYGYAVIRNAIIRAVFLAGLQPAIGLHHDNYLNAFNLADDLIEPWRPLVDLIAIEDPGDSVILDRKRRRKLAMVLHQACLIEGMKMPVLEGIGEMVTSFRNRIVIDKTIELKLPDVIAPELIEAIKE